MTLQWACPQRLTTAVATAFVALMFGRRATVDIPGSVPTPRPPPTSGWHPAVSETVTFDLTDTRLRSAVLQAGTLRVLFPVRLLEF
jgi:hypothetical protein